MAEDPRYIREEEEQSIAVRNKLGQLIADPHAQKERWKEHFSELLNPPPQDLASYT